MMGKHRVLPQSLSILSIFLLLLPQTSAEVDPDELGSGIGRFNSIICQDVDQDGKMEILFGSYEGYVTSVEYKLGDYSVDWRSAKYGTRCWGLEAGQFDEDDALEIIIGDGDGNVRAVDGRTKKVEWTSDTLDRDAHGLLLHDVDKDGRNELLAGTGFKTDQGWGQVYFFEQGNSTPYRTLPSPWNSRLRELAVADLDQALAGLICETEGIRAHQLHLSLADACIGTHGPLSPTLVHVLRSA